MPLSLQSAQMAIGSKQTKKAIEKGIAEKVYIAKDAEDKVVAGIINMCRQKSINIIYIDTMNELGDLCKIDVGAASIAILKQ